MSQTWLNEMLNNQHRLPLTRWRLSVMLFPLHKILLVSVIRLIIYRVKFFSHTSGEQLHDFTHDLSGYQPQDLLLFNSDEILTFLWYVLTIMKIITSMLNAKIQKEITNAWLKWKKLHFVTPIPTKWNLFHQSVHQFKPLLLWNQQVTAKY